MLLALNSCINPLVYATTIPAFKELIQALCSCKLRSQLTDTKETRSSIWSAGLSSNTKNKRTNKETKETKETNEQKIELNSIENEN